MGIIIGLILYGALIYYICASFNSKVTFDDWLVMFIFSPFVAILIIIAYLINLYYDIKNEIKKDYNNS